MGCWACNPYCGNCKPPLPKPRPCPSCQRLCFNPTEETCPNCYKQLTPYISPKVVKCSYSGLVCANPCNKHKIILPGGRVMPCKTNTPPAKRIKV
jgi:hypothetical protein